MANESKIIQNRKILSSFLEIRSIPDQYKAPYKPNERNPYGYIYCIENKINNKKYIGSTYSVWVGISEPNMIVPLKKRASHYIYNYNRMKNYSETDKLLLRPIDKALVDYGIENFVMYPIAETTRENHIEAELYFIKKFDTIVSGYNSHFVRSYKNRVGRSLSPMDKKLRSEPIIAINFKDKKIIMSDSMKLFADFIGSSKDMIKNAVRSCVIYKGWFIAYASEEKRNELMNKLINHELPYQQKRSIGKDRINFCLDMSKHITEYLSDYTNSNVFFDFNVLPSLKYEE